MGGRTRKDAGKALDRSIGTRVRTRREQLGVTQEDLGTAVGLTRASIANVESGKQGLYVSTLVALAAALDITPASLLHALRSRGKGDRGWLQAANGRVSQAMSVLGGTDD